MGDYLTGAILATAVIGAAKFDTSGSGFTLNYPNFLIWFYIILAWIIMLRFFVRSALGLANMYRWNTLINACTKVLSVNDDHPSLPVFQRNLAMKADAYFYRWKSPISQGKLAWANLKLMYLWFFVIILGLFAWGLYALPRDTPYFLGIVAFIVPTAFEYYWFRNWHGLQFEAVSTEKEPDLQVAWQQNNSHPGTERVTIDGSRVVVFGFCTEGPYKFAERVLSDQGVSWMPWSYHERNIEKGLLADLRRGVTLSDRRVAFACWSPTFTGQVQAMRWGRVDHYAFANGTMRVTVFLQAATEADALAVHVTDPNVLCFYCAQQEVGKHLASVDHTNVALSQGSQPQPNDDADKGAALESQPSHPQTP